MIALKLVMTTAGLGRFTAAQTDTGVDLTVTEVGLSDAAFVAAPTLTALPSEFRRIDTVSGASVGDNIVHMTVQDDAAISYVVRGFGLWLGDGTLFATYSQADPIAEKATGSMLALAIDIAFPEAGIDTITFGDTNFLNPPATSERKGVVELATMIEAEGGDTARATTGAVVKAMIATAIDAVTEAIDGLRARTIYGAGLVKGGGTLGTNLTLTVDSASGDDVRTGVRTDLAVRRMDRLSSRLTSAIVTGSAIPALAMAGAVGAAPASPGAASIAPRSYTIHINQQPGQDAQALARAVADELDRRDRERAARRRSSFADTPDYETV